MKDYRERDIYCILKTLSANYKRRIYIWRSQETKYKKK